MRGMRPAKNPKARSAFKPRQIRSRRDAEEIEFDDEDYEALEDCDGTEEGQVAELCKQPRVSAWFIRRNFRISTWNTILIYFLVRFCPRKKTQAIHHLPCQVVRKIHFRMSRSKSS